MDAAISWIVELQVESSRVESKAPVDGWVGVSSCFGGEGENDRMPGAWQCGLSVFFLEARFVPDPVPVPGAHVEVEWPELRTREIVSAYKKGAQAAHECQPSSLYQLSMMNGRLKLGMKSLARVSSTQIWQILQIGLEIKCEMLSPGGR